MDAKFCISEKQRGHEAKDGKLEWKMTGSFTDDSDNVWQWTCGKPKEEVDLKKAQ